MATTAANTSSERINHSSSARSSADAAELVYQGSAATAAGDPIDQGGAAEVDGAGDGDVETSHSSGTAGLNEALKAERRRSNNLEKELRGLRQQLTRFSEINPEEYARLQQADRQKQLLEQQLELRERQMEEAAAKRVAAVSAERDAAHLRVQELRKERLLERAFTEAEGRSGGDERGTFFQVFRSMLWDCFRLASGKDGSDSLEPLDGQGQPLLGDDGRAMTTADYLDQLRIHPVYGFLFQQRGGIATAAAGLAGLSNAATGFGEVLNPQAMSASELYRAGFGGSARR